LWNPLFSLYPYHKLSIPCTFCSTRLTSSPRLTSISPYSVFPVTFSILPLLQSFLAKCFHCAHGGHFIDNSGTFYSHFMRPWGNYLISKGLKVINKQIWCSSCIIFWELLGMLSNICPMPDIKCALFRGIIKIITSIFQGHWRTNLW
jgi:hypothetical protein